MNVFLLQDENDVHDFVDRIGAGSLVTEELLSALEQAWMFECVLFVRDLGRQFQWMQVREKKLRDDKVRHAIMHSPNMWPTPEVVK